MEIEKEEEYTTFSTFQNFDPSWCCNQGFSVRADKLRDFHSLPPFCEVWFADGEEEGEWVSPPHVWQTPPSSPKRSSVHGLPPPATVVKPCLPPPETRVQSKPVFQSFSELGSQLCSEDSSSETISDDPATGPVFLPPALPPLEPLAEKPKPKRKKRRLKDKTEEDVFVKPQRKKKKLNPCQARKNRADRKKAVSETQLGKKVEEKFEESKDHKGKVRVLTSQNAQSRVKKRKRKRKLTASSLRSKPLKPSALKPKKVRHPITNSKNIPINPSQKVPHEIGISDDIMGFKRVETQSPPSKNVNPSAKVSSPPSTKSPTSPKDTSASKKSRPKILKSIPRPRVTTTKQGLTKYNNIYFSKTKRKWWGRVVLGEEKVYTKLFDTDVEAAMALNREMEKRHLRPPNEIALAHSPTDKTVNPNQNLRQRPSTPANAQRQSIHVNLQVNVHTSAYSKDPRLDPRLRAREAPAITSSKTNSILKKGGANKNQKRSRVRFKSSETTSPITWSPEPSPRSRPDPASQKPTQQSLSEKGGELSPRQVLRIEIEKLLRERRCWTCINILEEQVQILLKGQNFMKFLNNSCSDFLEFDPSYLLVRYVPLERRNKPTAMKPRKVKSNASPWFCLLQKGVALYRSRDFSEEPLRVLSFGQLVNIQEKTTEYIELGVPHHGFCKPFDCIEAGLARIKPKTDTYEYRELMARSDLLGITIFRPTNRLTGHWQGANETNEGKYWIQESDRGELTGYIDDPNSSSIRGKRTGPKISMQIHYQSNIKVNVKAKLSASLESMLMNFVCVYADGQRTPGSKTIKKQPLGKLTGVWQGGSGKESLFHFRHYECGLLLGYQYRKSWCQILGVVKNDKFIFKQIWGKESWVDDGDVSMSRGLILSHDVMEVSYAMLLAGQLRTGTNVLRRKHH